MWCLLIKIFWLIFFLRLDIFPENIGSLSCPSPVSQSHPEGTLFLRQLLKTAASLVLRLNLPLTNRLVKRWLICCSWPITNQDSNFVHKLSKVWMMEATQATFFLSLFVCFRSEYRKLFAFIVLVWEHVEHG